VRHRQTKGSATDRSHLNHRATPRLHKISIRLGPIADVKDWLNNYQAFEKTPVVTIDAGGVQLVGSELQFDCRLDDYAS